MTSLDRRAALRLSGAALATAVAGCLSANGGAADPNDEGTDPTDDETTASDDHGDLVGYDVIRHGGPDGAPDWYDEETANLVVVDDEERARAVFGDDASEDVREAVAETDFDSAVLLSLVVAAPTACYGVAVDDVSLDGGRLTGAASAVDGSDDGMCAQVVSFPGALVRARFDGPPVTEASLAATDGWGDRVELAASADDSLAPAPADLEGHVRPDGDPGTVPPAPSCDDANFERHPSPVDDGVEWGLATDDDGDPTFALRVDALSVERGDVVTLRLTNVADEQLVTGNRNKYNLQVYTEAGWQDVRGSRELERIGYSDEGILHRPGEGFEWSLRLTEDGVVADHSDLEVCPDLPAGRYRFVFWEPAVAVAFDVA